MLGVCFNLNGLSRSIYEVTYFLKSHNYYYLGKTVIKYQYLEIINIFLK